jgi:hypothetical protein
LTGAASYLACSGNVDKFTEVAKPKLVVPKPGTVSATDEIINGESNIRVSTIIEGW